VLVELAVNVPPATKFPLPSIELELGKVVVPVQTAPLRVLLVKVSVFVSVPRVDPEEGTESKLPPVLFTIVSIFFVTVVAPHDVSDKNSRTRTDSLKIFMRTPLLLTRLFNPDTISITNE
jgi:hypothetical protein